MNSQDDDFLNEVNGRINPEEVLEYIKSHFGNEQTELLLALNQLNPYQNIITGLEIYTCILSQEYQISLSDLVMALKEELSPKDALWIDIIVESVNHYGNQFPLDAFLKLIDEKIEEGKIRDVNIRKLLTRFTNYFFFKEVQRLLKTDKYRELNDVRLMQDETGGTVKTLKFYAEVSNLDDLKKYKKFVGKNSDNESLTISNDLIYQTLSETYIQADAIINDLDNFLKLQGQKERDRLAIMTSHLFETLTSKSFIEQLFFRDIENDFAWIKKSRRHKLLILSEFFELTHCFLPEEKWYSMGNQEKRTLKGYEKYRIREVLKIIS